MGQSQQIPQHLPSSTALQVSAQHWTSLPGTALHIDWQRFYSRGWHSFSEKGQIVNILGSADHVVSVTTAQHCPCLEAAIGNGCGTIPAPFHLPKRVWGHSLLTPFLFFFFLIQSPSRKFHLGDDIQDRLHLIRVIYMLWCDNLASYIGW